MDIDGDENDMAAIRQEMIQGLTLLQPNREDEEEEVAQVPPRVLDALVERNPHQVEQILGDAIAAGDSPQGYLDQVLRHDLYKNNDAKQARLCSVLLGRAVTSVRLPMVEMLLNLERRWALRPTST